MTKQEHLLTILSEECAEVSHRVSKALRFGLQDTQKGQDLTNAERLRMEYADLVTAYAALNEHGMVWPVTPDLIERKRERIERYLEYSKKLGTLI